MTKAGLHPANERKNFSRELLLTSKMQSIIKCFSTFYELLFFSHYALRDLELVIYLCTCAQMAVSSVKGCVSVGQEGNLYSQNSELRWGNKSVKQGMKYQVLGPEPHGQNKLACLICYG